MRSHQTVPISTPPLHCPQCGSVYMWKPGLVDWEESRFVGCLTCGAIRDDAPPPTTVTAAQRWEDVRCAFWDARANHWVAPVTSVVAALGGPLGADFKRTVDWAQLRDRVTLTAPGGMTWGGAPVVPVDPTVTHFNKWLGRAWEDWLWEWLTGPIPLPTKGWAGTARCDAILTAVVNRRSPYQRGDRSTAPPTDAQWNRLVDQLVRLGAAFTDYPDALGSAGVPVSSQVLVGHAMVPSVHGIVDFWIGDTLWDSKVTRKLSWSNAYWQQLIAYYILALVDGRHVARVGVHYPRFAGYATLSAHDIEAACDIEAAARLLVPALALPPMPHAPLLPTPTLADVAREVRDEMADAWNRSLWTTSALADLFRSDVATIRQTLKRLKIEPIPGGRRYITAAVTALATDRGWGMTTPETVYLRARRHRSWEQAARQRWLKAARAIESYNTRHAQVGGCPRPCYETVIQAWAHRHRPI